MPDFSIIIPVWNTPDNYLKTCIGSLMSNRCSFEVLLVDDGSGEDYAKRLDSYGSGCVRVLHKEHGGISKARNYGLCFAEGTYVTHADSDDYFAPGILDFVLEKFKEGGHDLIIGMIARCEDVEDEGDGEERTLITAGSPEIMKRRLRIYYTDMNDASFRRPGKWVNRAPHAKYMTQELALRIPFREEVPYCEDVIWNFDLLRQASSPAVLPMLCYYYIDVPFSNTQKFRENSPSEIRTLLRYYHREISGWPEEDHPQFEVAAMEYFSMLMRVYVFFGDPNTRQERYEEVIGDSLWRKIFRNVRTERLSGQYRIAGELGKRQWWKALYLAYEARYLSNRIAPLKRLKQLLSSEMDGT